MAEVSIAVAAELLEHYVLAGDPVFLWGMPGIGKTEVVGQLGKKLSWKVIDFRANLREPVDLRGIPVPDTVSGTTRWFAPDELPQAERDGEFGILFIDEMNTASTQMMAACMGLVLERRVGEYELPPGWVVVAAGNRVKDRAAAQRMPTALRNRFAHIEVCVDVPSWVAWAVTAKVAPEIVAFVRFRPTLLHIMPAGDENAFPSPRSITKCAKHVGAPAAIRQRLFAGHIGDDVAGELEGFVRLYRAYGTLDAILTTPDTAKIPVEPSERYAVCTGVATMVDRKTMPNLIKFAQRLPREFEILAVTDATRRNEDLVNVPAYGAWAVRNQDVLVQ